jgi:hypothetical protein
VNPFGNFDPVPRIYAAETMTTLETELPITAATDELPFPQRLRTAMALLEAIDADRGLLAQVSREECEQFLRLTRQVVDPDPKARRRLVKASIKARKAARVNADEQVLASTGIRELRQKPVFTTPNYYLPKAFREEP